MAKKKALSKRFQELSAVQKGIGIGLLGLFLIMFVSTFIVKREMNKPEIVVYNLDGQIVSSSQSSTGYITPKLVHSIREEINDSDNIKAVVLFINSPGGSVWASEEIANEISKIKKPVIASMGEMAASGGYYISCYCNKIVAYPTTITGSIGVIMMVVNMSELMEKIGVKVETYHLGKYKDIYDGFRSLNDDEKAVINSNVAEVYDTFVDVVATQRNLPRSKVKELATGQIYMGAEALNLGLIDKLGTVDDAVELAAQMSGADKNKVRDDRYKTSWLSSLSGKLGNFIDWATIIPNGGIKVEFQYR